MRRSIWLGLLLAGVVAAGCAGATTGGGSRGGRNEITAEEALSVQVQSAFDLVRALRPHWLEARGQQTFGSTAGGQVQVYVDGTRMGGVEVLRQLRAADVGGAAYMGGSEAASRYGLDHSAGAILIRSRR